MINTNWINKELVKDINTYTDHIQANQLKLTQEESENIFNKICCAMEENIQNELLDYEQEENLLWNFIDATIGVTKNCKIRSIEEYKKIFELEYIKII